MTKKNTITIIDLTWLHVARRNVEEVTGCWISPQRRCWRERGWGLERVSVRFFA
ncbi:hypothetical protein Scep_022804 [Stephania cephalantha]|uniref:Uncharacterized protein n=1 Tax=Stephania cephalantha TaxID=152367 RepID=A0AAP0I2J4_9MAGN